VDAPDQAMAGAGRRIRVKVSLADSVKAKADPQDSLFVFARAAEGPPMPLAVVRKQAKDLPLEVVLDDSMSMMQGMNLSSFERLVIGARVSKSGKPTPSPGDLQGLTEPVAPVKDETLSVVVDREVGPSGK
jgi:cytochrome c-type biogenesis protein CcmH